MSRMSIRVISCATVCNHEQLFLHHSRSICCISRMRGSTGIGVMTSSSSSAASDCMLGIKCPYTSSVMEGFEWPSRLDTTIGGMLLFGDNFIFYSEQANTYWIVPSLELVKEANQNKEGVNKGKYRIVFVNITRKGLKPRPRFKKYENAFNLLDL